MTLEPDPIRATTFNIRYDAPDDEQPWARRRRRVVEAIERLDPDVLGLQEATATQYDDLEDALPGYEWYGVGRADGDREGEFAPIAWRTDGYEAIETGTFWLSETPDEPSVGWDAALPRIASWVDLVRETGERLWICNAHFDHAGERARWESARLLRERADRRRADDRPVVVTGDFNCTSDSSPYEIVTDGDLTDARAVASAVRGPEGTFHGFTGDLRDRIDYVFVSPDVSVRRYRALEPRKECFRSDHVPLTADLVVDDPDTE